MKIVIFGLTISSSWGNGHATLWRALCRSLVRRGHEIIFFERDVPYYAANRDLTHIPSGQLHLYRSWADVYPLAREQTQTADLALVTSYCPDAVQATDLILDSRAGVRAFYDLDTPVTLDRLRSGQEVSYLSPRCLGEFDLVLSYTGGRALDDLKRMLGARYVLPLYGSVDPSQHRPAAPEPAFKADLSYMGTYAADRQHSLQQLFIEPARLLSQNRFVISGAQYPEQFPWTPNIFFVRHLPPPQHAAFFSSCRLTLNVTRQAMAHYGWCPSGRLFEAAACGAAIVTDAWEGLQEFFAPGEEILVARNTQDVVDALHLSDLELRQIADAGRERVLNQHTADHRALELEHAVAAVLDRSNQPRGSISRNLRHSA